MDERTQRFAERAPRIDLELPVQLDHDDCHEPFQASATNLGPGGISMRAQCLPDVGERLRCRFACPPHGVTVEALGEVVWARIEDDGLAEFGFAFLDLDAQTEMLIEEIVAETAAHSTAAGLSPDTGTPISHFELHVEGSAAPITGRLAREDERETVFEQELDLLSLGRAVLAQGDGSDRREGRIAGVELRMMGNVPTLAVRVAYREKDQEYGEYTFSEAVADNGRDTEPDLEPPAAQYFDAVYTRTTLGEYPVGERVELDPEQLDAELSSVLDEPAPEAQVEAEAPTEPDALDAPAERLASAPRAAQAASASVSVASGKASDGPAAARVVISSAGTRPGADSDAWEDAEEEPLAEESESVAVLGPSPMQRLQQRLAPAREQMAATAGGAAAAASRAVPQLRGLWLPLRRHLTAFYGRNLATSLGAVRRLMEQQLPRRRRRTASAAASRRKFVQRGALVRKALLGLLAAVTAGLAAYALSPVTPDADLQPHREVKLPKVSEEAVSVVAAPAPVLAAEPASAVPSAEQVPASSPFAVDVREGQSTGETSRALKSFGAADVPGGRHFSLRMSAPIERIRGVADEGGFTVIVPGSLSLDRAGPIAAAHRLVRRSMILNKGDRSELTIRFVGEDHPAYRVLADGDTLRITIEDRK
ncbi:MAG: PilZ domain-containing protein [Myxococcales bacterium]|nr:PilZ domain-containing protein [Myxococcales bacterium]